MTEVLSKDCGERGLHQERDMSESSQHHYSHPPPDIMPKGLAINGILIDDNLMNYLMYLLYVIYLMF